MMQAVEPAQAAPVQYTSPLTPPISNTGSPSVASTPLNDAVAPAMSITSHHHILIVTGPAGCGKSTIAKYLSERYGFAYIEGDEVCITKSKSPEMYQHE
jgi:gluconokinase